MDLHGRQSGHLERVVDGVGVVGPGPGVEDDAVRQPFQAVEMLDEVALVVGLEEARDQPGLGPDFGDVALELLVVHRAVVLGVTASELVEVDAVHHLDPVACDRAHELANSRTAPIRSRAATSQSGRAAPGWSRSTNGTGPSPTRFLSRAVAMTTASGSTPASIVGRLWPANKA